VFKKLIYEMRFDRASAEYAEFGPFYVGLQFAPSRLADLLDGRTPQLVQVVLTRLRWTSEKSETRCNSVTSRKIEAPLQGRGVWGVGL
jgi:hypothetical protein